jgi:cytochrome P450
MTPIFGKGVVFDASPKRRQEMLKNQALRGEHMKGHAATIEREIRLMVDRWGDEGEIDLLDFFAELTIYTTSSCLIGRRFRDQIDGRFAGHYHDLERGTDALAYADPLRGHRVVPPARRRAPGARRARAGHHGPPRGGAEGARGRSATSSTSSCRSGTTTGRRTSPPTRSPGCSSR